MWKLFFQPLFGIELCSIISGLSFSIPEMMISDSYSFGDGPTMVSIQLGLNQLIRLGWTNQLYGFQLGGSISWLVQWCCSCIYWTKQLFVQDRWTVSILGFLLSPWAREPNGRGQWLVMASERGPGWVWISSTNDLRSLNLHVGVCWYMLLTFKVESLVFSCPNDACRVPHAAYIDYPKNCHEGQRGGAQIWAPMDPHNCEEEHFLCSARTRKSRNPIVYVSWSSNSSLELIFGW